MKDYKYLVFLLICLLIYSCTAKEQEALDDFESLKSSFVNDLWEINPSRALAVGNFNYDDRLTIPDERYRNDRDHFLSKYEERLNDIPVEHLPPPEEIDYRLIDNYLKRKKWYRDEFQSHNWNPASYNVAGSISRVLNGRYAPLDERLTSLYQMLELVPEYYTAAEANLDTPTKPHTELAVQQNRGTIRVLDGALRDSLSVLKNSTEWDTDPEWANSFSSRIDRSIHAVESYIDMLHDRWLEPANCNGDSNSTVEDPDCSDRFRDFRIGNDLYRQKFNLDNVSYFDADEIYRQAVQNKKELHQEMMGLSAELWDSYHPGKQMPDDLTRVQRVLDEIAKNHVHRDSLVSAIRAQIPELEAFVTENELIHIDPDKPLIVLETPEYMRGVSVASISAPGPYDIEGDTYYNVSPIDHLTGEEAESHLREYNHYTLQILNMHEAIPGHYTQLVYSRQSPSIIKSVLGNSAMVEGWANYTERMMLDEGYGDFKPELWLMYYKWHLRTVTNTIFDYRIHNDEYRYSREEGLDLLMNEAFQERTEAEGKWRRATLTQVQLTSYFTGYTEIWNLRKEWEEQ